jgi:hypothetical protein
MLNADCCDDVAMIDLPVCDLGSWHENIGLLVIDRDYLQLLSANSLEPWIQKVLDGSSILLVGQPSDEHLSESALGPQIAAGKLEVLDASGEITILKKKGASYWIRRREAATWIRERAEQVGYSGDEAAGRLLYGSFVSVPNRYVFVETPKAACTSWKRFLVEMEDARVDDKARFYQRETTLEMLIHQRQHIRIPTLLDISLNTLEEIWATDTDWFKFAIVRNPFSRLVSVFENKVRFGEPGYQHLEARFGDRSGFNNAGEAFTAFACEVSSDAELRAKDAHLRSQVDLLMPKLVQYSRVFRMEDMNEAVSLVNQRTAQGKHPVKLPSSNESTRRPWKSYYSLQTAEAVATAYAEDFEEFGFDTNDWRSDEHNFEESAAELAARARVVQRNAMIDRLYDWVIEKR